MAIFGNLRDIGLLDLLPLLAHKKGRLMLIRKKGTLELYLSGRRVICAEEDHRVLSPNQLEERLFELVQEGEGGFEFFRNESPKHRRGCLNLAIDELVLKLATQKDELENVRGHLPHPDTVFTLDHVALAYNDPNLAEFLDRAWPHLSAGASAQELAQALGMPLERVRYLLYKLRTLGAIEPFERPPQPSRERQGIARRLLGLIRRRFARASWNP